MGSEERHFDVSVGSDGQKKFNFFLHHLDDPLPRKQPKMVAKLNYLKSLKLQSHCMQINFIFTVRTNMVLSTFVPRSLWLLSLSFILLYYLHFMLVKMIPTIIQIGIRLKQISPSTNRMVKVKINTDTNSMQTFKTTFNHSGALGFYN